MNSNEKEEERTCKGKDEHAIIKCIRFLSRPGAVSICQVGVQEISRYPKTELRLIKEEELYESLPV